MVFERILFPVRPVPGALAKYEFARPLIRQPNTSLTVLALTAPDEIISQEQVRETLAELTLKLTKDDSKNHIVFCTTDSMAETVLIQAADLQADLVIITAQLATPSDNFFIGPFTQQIIHTAQLPVLSIRPESGVDPNAARVIWQDDRTNSGHDFIDL